MEHDGNFKDKAPLAQAPIKTKPGSISISQQPLDQATPSLAPLTPRIDISRASSSSYHEDSSPENVFDQVGTGILTTEATGSLGFREDGALELRSSTEELFFMEPEKGQTECEKPLAPQRMIFKFDDTHSVTLHQFQRKDSGCSEVAAFLNISGRTSRISSVGSQGSAVSRLSGLSAVSGVSRSPSPHRMLVETSFCGPKPIEPASDASSMEQIGADTLEQVILARRRDPTEAVMAEGVNMKIAQKTKTNGAVTIKEPVIDIESKVAQKVIAFNKAEELRALKPRLNSLTVSKSSNKKETKKVVGAFPSGTQYTRIKLKPDHLYDDKGLSPNERIIDVNDFSTKKKGDKKEMKPVEDINQITKIGGDKQSPADARSPSPALSVSVSRKTSFCSLFKSRDSSVNSDQSAGPNKKRSNSKDAGKGKNKFTDNSPTPSPKSSPMDHSKAQPKQSTSNDAGDHKSRPKSRLRYYDPPADGSIHIPLHTPPDEKDFNIKTKPVIAILPPKKKEKIEVVEKIEIAPEVVVKPRKVGPKPPVRMYPPTEKKIEAPSEPPPAPPIIVATKPKRAPLYLPSEDRFSEDKEGASSWSVDVQRHSSQESQETVISSQINSNDDTPSRNGEKISAKNESVIENLPPLNISAKGRNKRHILFSTKIGSGSEEQIFMTQLSLSKTESQSSQLSEQVSVFESPKNEECSAKACSSNTSQDELCKITLRKQKTFKSPSETDTSSKRESIKSRDSSESNRKRDSSESKKRDSGEASTITPDYHSPKSPMSSQTSLTPPQPKSIPETSRMEISSESDRESDVVTSEIRRHHITPRSSNQMEDHESTGLVLQGFLQESFDDELPYVPTTLPEERCSGLRIVPIKERSQIELKTCQVNRPRSTTPINPLQSLENYCERRQSDDQEAGGLVRGEKLRISLPRKGAEEKVVKGITRRISNLSNKSWTEFAEQNIQGPSVATPLSAKNDKPLEDFPPPPLPPRKSTSTKWIDFENIPEKRQPPKKITTIPSKDPLHDKSHASKSSQRVHYNYVDPEECQCECHEGAAHKEDSPKHSPHETTPTGKTPPTEDSQPLLADTSEKNERNSMMSTDSSLEYSLEHEKHGLLQTHHKPKSPSNLNLDKPFGMDLSVELGGHSNRSSIVEVSDSSAF